jgi:hypothetical protein
MQRTESIKWKSSAALMTAIVRMPDEEENDRAINGDAQWHASLLRKVPACIAAPYFCF